MTTDKQRRKERPIARGGVDYFPDAIAEVANVSYVGNQQHNPGGRCIGPRTRAKTTPTAWPGT